MSNNRTLCASLSTMLCMPVLVASLGGCTSAKLQSEVDNHYDTAPKDKIGTGLADANKIKGSATDVAARLAKAQDAPLVRRASQPWIGGRFSPATKVDGLPALFDESYVLDFGEGRVSLPVLATRLTKITGVPVRVRSDLVSAPAATQATSTGASGARPTGVPAPGLASIGTATASNESASIPNSSASANVAATVDGVSMRWNGKLRDFLDFLANTLNLSWEYNDGAVVIMANVVESHPVFGMVGLQTFENSVGSSATGSTSSGGSSGSNLQSADSYSDKGTLNGYEAIISTVRGMVGTGPGRSVSPDASTGTIVVAAPKDIQAQVRDYLREKNKALSQLVSVTLDIYSFKDSAVDTQGINWNLVFSNIAKSYSIASASPASLAGSSTGSFTLTSLAGEATGTNVILQALNQTGKSFTHTPVTLTTTNGRLKVSQPSVQSQGYVSKTTPSTTSSTGTTGTTGLETSTITTGDVYSVLPIIQPDQSIDLRYSFRLSTLLGLTTFTSGTGTSAQSVQIPKTSSISDTATVHLAPGQAVLIAGLSRIVSASDNNRLAEGASIAAGGSTSNNLTREHVIVLVRATPLGTPAQ
jgi:type IVB pilus formation R64 PilN family outer membrane protein